MDKNLYKILGVNVNASDIAIKIAYRKLAFKYHPNKNTDSNATKQFMEIARAYQVLSNKSKRRIYDDFCMHPLNKISITGSKFVKDPPILYECFVTLEIINTGFVLSFPKPGAIEKNENHFARYIFCFIKPGCPNDERIVIHNVGQKTIGHIPSDLIVTVRTVPHNIFKRDGMNLHYTANVTVKQVLCGYTFIFMGLNGYVSLKTPSDPTIVKIYKGFGLPDYNDCTKRGDLHVTFKVSYPPELPAQKILKLCEILP